MKRVTWILLLACVCLPASPLKAFSPGDPVEPELAGVVTRSDGSRVAILREIGPVEVGQAISFKSGSRMYRAVVLAISADGVDLDVQTEAVPESTAEPEPGQEAEMPAAPTVPEPEPAPEPVRTGPRDPFLPVGYDR